MGRTGNDPAIQVKDRAKGHGNKVYCHSSEVNEVLKHWLLFLVAKIETSAGCAFSCSHLM